MKIAVAHEWVSALAGSEQVFETIAGIVPSADLFALSVEPGVDLDMGGRPITTTALDNRLLRGRRGATLPLMPLAWRALRAGGYDAVISSHHAFAASNRLATGGLNLAYVYAPARYVWTPELDVRGASPHLAPARALLKRVDLKAVAKLGAISVVSSAVATRVATYWNRESTVIFPPVRFEYFTQGGQEPPAEQGYLLGFGRWIPYKAMPRVIEIGDRLGLPVKIAGRGPEKAAIERAAAAAKVPVEIIESPSNEQLRELYRGALALVFPTVEDFGIVPVEAQAAGTPVVALAEGGALDTVVPGVTGALVGNDDLSEWAAAVESVQNISPEACQQNAQLFSRAEFERRFGEWLTANGIPASDVKSA